MVHAMMAHAIDILFFIAAIGAVASLLGCVRAVSGAVIRLRREAAAPSRVRITWVQAAAPRRISRVRRHPAMGANAINRLPRRFRRSDAA